MIRIGLGYDVHALGPGTSLVLGGVRIAHTQGLLGHSDADVLAHAVADAVLGALALGDIGQHFPPSDPAYKGADSIALLSQVRALAHRAGYRLGNLDCVVICEQPKIAPHAAQMRACLARALAADVSQVSVKATTTETLGFEGRKEGIAAQAIVFMHATDSARTDGHNA